MVMMMLRHSRNNNRQLCYESLEDRRMLAPLVVDSVSDTFAPGTLRTAIRDSNLNTTIKDEITFDVGLFSSGIPVFNLGSSISVTVPVKIHSQFGNVVIQPSIGSSAEEALLLTPNLSQGIGQDFEISNLFIQGFTYGIRVTDSGGIPDSSVEGVNIVNNVFVDNERGIFFDRSLTPFEIRDNQIFGIQGSVTPGNPNRAGIWIENTTTQTNTFSPVIDNNIIVDNEDYGIIVLDAKLPNLDITGNRIGADGALIPKRQLRHDRRDLGRRGSRRRRGGRHRGSRSGLCPVRTGAPGGELDDRPLRIFGRTCYSQGKLTADNYTAATTIRVASRCGWPAAGSGRDSSTARPIRSDMLRT